MQQNCDIAAPLAGKCEIPWFCLCARKTILTLCWSQAKQLDELSSHNVQNKTDLWYSRPPSREMWGVERVEEGGGVRECKGVEGVAKGMLGWRWWWGQGWGDQTVAQLRRRHKLSSTRRHTCLSLTWKTREYWWGTWWTYSWGKTRVVQNIADNDYHHDEDNRGPIVVADIHISDHPLHFQIWWGRD